MDTLELMKGRRSIRKYKDQPVEAEKIKWILEAAMSAPTACNNQPWEFVVTDDPTVLEHLRSKLTFGKYNAPLAITVCGNLKLAKGGMENYWVQDCAAAMENILLMSTALGLGSVWIGVYPLPSVIKPVSLVLNLPEHVIPLGLAYIGYAAEQPEPRTQYDEKHIYNQVYEADRKHRARPKTSQLKHL